MVEYCVVAAAIYVGVLLLAKLFCTLDQAGIPLDPMSNTVLLAGAIFGTGLIRAGRLPLWWTVPFFVYLLYAAIMDAKTKTVYDSIHYPILLLLFAALFMQVSARPAQWPAVLVPLGVYGAFLIAQWRLHCYGFADTLTFATAGLFSCNLSVHGGGMLPFEGLAYLLGLANSFFIIANIGNFAGLKLRESAAFIPAIALAVGVLAAKAVAIF